MLLTLLLLIADFAGVPKGVVNGFFLVVSIIGYAVIGMFCRTANPDEYFVAGRRISAPLNGMATAADWISAASFIGLTGLVAVGRLCGRWPAPGRFVLPAGMDGGLLFVGLFVCRQTESVAVPSRFQIF